MADRPGGARPFDLATLVVVGALGVVLVAGYVILASLGRDVTGYVLFLGGPAVTGIVGMVLTRRVTAVEDRVEVSHTDTRQLVAETASDLDSHLSDQDRVIEATAAAADAARKAASGQSAALPVPRGAPVSPFGPVRAGLTREKRSDA